MKELKLKIEDNVYQELKSALLAKKFTGSFYGITDEFINLIIKSIEEGKEEKVIALK